MGPGHAIYTRKSSLDAGGFAEESGIVMVCCLDVPRRIVWPLREHTRVRQYPPAVTAIKISAFLPGATLTSKSGERLDRPQPGLTKFCQFYGFYLNILTWVMSERFVPYTRVYETSARVWDRFIPAYAWDSFWWHHKGPETSQSTDLIKWPIYFDHLIDIMGI